VERALHGLVVVAARQDASEVEEEQEHDVGARKGIGRLRW
jgi:hypothetical protein